MTSPMLFQTPLEWRMSFSVRFNEVDVLRYFYSIQTRSMTGVITAVKGWATG
ncbi:MAG: hypothetical protein VX505_08675 [Chloroflexota bacterium]|nr:hypothetical protein [Chloroflexota bacterium]